jgi:hypothetical protein
MDVRGRWSNVLFLRKSDNPKIAQTHKQTEVLRSYGRLHCVNGQFATDVSRQGIASIFKGQDVQEEISQIEINASPLLCPKNWTFLVSFLRKTRRQ